VFVTNMPAGGLGGSVGGAAKGGLLGGLAKGAGVLGITAIAAGAVALVHNDLTQRNAKIAEGLAPQLDKFTGENNLSRRELTTALAGVRGKIGELESLPFFAPGRDESLAAVREIEAGLVAELELTRNAIRTSSSEQTAAYARFRQQEMSASHTREERVASVLERFQSQERDTENATRARIENLERLSGEASEGARAAAAKAQQDAANQKGAIEAVRSEAVTFRGASVAATGRSEAAARNAGLITASASIAAANRIVGAIWAARPVIQSTTIVNQTTNNNRNSTNASRHR
jgi:hypothetical protein